jgi:GT2 family glycosyltransferase
MTPPNEGESKTTLDANEQEGPPAVDASVHPFVSVVVPTWNRAAMLEHALGSLTSQNYPSDRYEIIVVDDGSTDATSEIANRFASSSTAPRIEWVQTPHRGLNAARNAGIAAAAGDPICFVDDDVEAPDAWLASVVSGALRHPQAGCLGGPVRMRLEGKTPRFCGRESLEEEFDAGAEDREVRAVWGCNLAVKRSAVQEVGMFDDRLAGSGDEEEWERRLQKAGGKVMYIANAWIWHRRTQDDLRLARMVRKSFRRGREEAAFDARMGTRVDARHDSSAMIRLFGHAVHHRCSWGFVAGSRQLGRLYGAIRPKEWHPRRC